MTKHISNIDTKRFGFKIAKINHFDKSPSELVAELKAEGTKLIMSRVSASNMDLISTLEKIGFRLKDVQLTYNSNLSKIPDQLGSLEFTIRDATDNDAEQISKIAEQAFHTYGHYYADDRLKNQTSAIYKEWALNSCLNKQIADKVIIAEFQGNVIGFLTFKIQENDQGKHAVGGIGAVSSIHRNMGVFKAINIAGLKWSKKIGLNRLEHNVLATNFPVNATYSKLGFNIIHSEVTMHFWMND